jgi:hypothetical protein
MPVTIGATPTELNFNDSTPAPPPGKLNVKWQVGSAYPDPNNGNQVRDGSAYVDDGGVNAQTGTSYTIVADDNRKLVTLDNGAAVAVTITAAATLGDGFKCSVENLGAGIVTLTPASGTIDGAGSLDLDQNQGVSIWSDGTNFYTVRGIGGSGGSGSVPAATTAAITTASLATNASESGSVTVFKSFLLLKIQFSCKARVELYSTAAARDADASRVWGTIPTLYAQNELICDVQMSSGSGTWIMSPSAPGFNADATRSTTIYYRITNLDTAQAVTATLTALQMES